MEAREGQVAVEVECGCEDEATLVAEHAVAAWTCGRCRHKPRPTGRRVVLGPGGSLPAGWRDQPTVQGAAA